ncbi:hypothetical protein GG804_13070 [Sphingomonas histidinilytica]|uniref:hypothetical protein n=1 Tax=Rhizorhabdus histidinilytica TaxID=439228 RepID=UPI001ADA92F1|nr:hypothetical protein [Rhizorhabdus histidinilytica]MBO9377701.1 hypothetical protein [Rhizorhabdus histidinilytica]
MTQQLNFTKKARQQFKGYAKTASRLSAPGFAYLERKLGAARTFMLPDHGELLDRSRVRSEMLGEQLRPPFPITALEYRSPARSGRYVRGFTEVPCSRRIALVWDHADDFPPIIETILQRPLGRGVCIASICYFDTSRMWLPIFAAAHFSYDEGWVEPAVATPFIVQSVLAGATTPEQVGAKRPSFTPIPLLPDALFGIGKVKGVVGLSDAIMADLQDEVNAYFDFAETIAGVVPRDRDLRKHGGING